MTLLPSDEYKIILDEINSLKTKLAVTDYFINNFKDDSLSSINKLEELKERVQSLEIKLYNNFQDIERSIKENTHNFDSKITVIQSALTSLTSNNFFNFTNNLDIKKWITFGGLFFSVLTSVGLFDDFLRKDISQDELQNKIERLIQLTQ